jgi:formamidopyrimidine-DNA glycosylase
MPELPEVETVVRDLRPLLVGRRLNAVRAGRKHLRTKWSKGWGAKLAGAGVRAVRRRGKWILVDLDPAGLLVLHLGMTGQLTVLRRETPLADHVHLVFALDDGGQELRFRDVRRFGSATFHADEEAWFGTLDDRLGPEPFDLEPGYWRKALVKSNRPLKAILLDQRVVAGVGNIYADESLFLAKLPPTQKGSETTPAQAERLRKAIVDVLTRAIDGRGTSIRDYVGGSGLRGGFQERLNAYGRAGKPCPRCGTPIEVIRLAGRSTHYCPKCQRLPKARG